MLIFTGSFFNLLYIGKYPNKYKRSTVLFLLITGDVCLEEDEENSERLASRKSRHGVITFTEEETAELAKIRPRDGATISEKVLVQSAAEKDRISEIKDKQAELETEPKFANCCSYCPKSFKKPSDLIRYTLFTYILPLERMIACPDWFSNNSLWQLCFRNSKNCSYSLESGGSSVGLKTSSRTKIILCVEIPETLLRYFLS